jgi:PAS domain S-box-containing protein
MADDQGEIILVNAQIEKLFGYDRSELLGKRVDVLLPARLGDGSLLRAARVSSDDAKLYGRRKDGQEIPIEVASNELETSEGRYVISSIADISERRRTERALLDKGAELTRSNRELEQFAYAASHDLREPLRMVATYVTLLQREYGEQLDASAREYMRFAVEGATRLTRLVTDLLEYARIGPKMLTLAPVDCNAVLAQVVEGLRANIEHMQASVVAEALPTVLGDHVLIHQVFQNLIENGIKFRSNAPPCVRISAEAVDAEWHFHFADNGLGIEPRFHSRIFQLFQRLHTNESYAGTGMGLALCKKVIERHGGRIWVESTLGEGSVFSFSLPAFRQVTPRP